MKRCICTWNDIQNQLNLTRTSENDLLDLEGEQRPTCIGREIITEKKHVTKSAYTKHVVDILSQLDS